MDARDVLARISRIPSARGRVRPVAAYDPRPEPLGPCFDAGLGHRDHDQGMGRAAKSGVLAKDILGLMTTRCPFLTKREMPPMASRAFFVAAAGSPEITARSYSSAARRKEGWPAMPMATPAAVVFRNCRRDIPCLSQPSLILFSFDDI